MERGGVVECGVTDMFWYGIGIVSMPYDAVSQSALLNFLRPPL